MIDYRQKFDDDFRELFTTSLRENSANLSAQQWHLRAGGIRFAMTHANREILTKTWRMSANAKRFKTVRPKTVQGKRIIR